MATATLFAEPQATLGFPQSLTEEYKPQRIADFVGLEKQKRILSNWLKSPKPTALLFQGVPGSGKTSMAYAIATELDATVWHVGSQECRAEKLAEIVAHCHYIPKAGLSGFHVVIVDEADVMSDAAQKFLLSKLDGTEPCPQTIWIFTANSTERLEERFLSRCTIKLEFNSYGSGEAIANFLAKIWRDKVGESPAEAPNFKKLACGNVRESLQRLETELLAV